MPVQPMPDGYHAVTPWIISRDTAKLLDFVAAAFGAEEVARVHNADGRIGHAETRIGDSVVMMFDAAEGWPTTPAFMRLYVDDCDRVYRQAIAAGATAITAISELFFGDRVGRVCDPFGNVWWIQTHVEDVAPELLGTRAQEPEAADAMQYVQHSLDMHMKARLHSPAM